MTEQESLGKVELELLQTVARLQPVSVRTLVDHLADDSGLARTTVLTMLERLRRKGFLSRTKIQGVNHYSPRVSIADLLRRLVGDFVQQTLGGSVLPFVAYLQDTREIDPAELDKLKSMVQKLKTRQASRTKGDNP